MKFLKSNYILLAIFLLLAALTFFFNFILGIYPLRDLVNYLEGTNLYWIIPMGGLIIMGMLLIYISMRKKIVNERVEIFNATIRTVLDILQNSSSSMQLLILDMKDESVDEQIIRKAEKNVEELRKVITALAAIDPITIELKELNKKVSVIKMEEQK